MITTASTHPFSARLAAGLATALVLALAGCAGSGSARGKFQPATTDSIAPLHKVELRLVKLVSGGNSVSLPATDPITLRFDDGGKVAGKSAVNRYFGAFKLGAAGAIEWPGGGLGMTRMAGPGPAMELENQFSRALTATTRLLASPDGARFESADAKNVLEFAR